MYTSQAGQDRFVVNILKGKMNGYFLEIGSNSPVHINNTFILEKRFISLSRKLIKYPAPMFMLGTPEINKIDFLLIQFY